MNPFLFVVRRPLTTLMLVAAVVGGGVFGLNKMRADTYPPQQTPKVYVYLDSATDGAKRAKEYVVHKYESYFHKENKEAEHHEGHKVVVTSALAKDVTITQEYVCQIHSQRHINVQAMEGGYLEAIPIKEGQKVKKGDLMFKVIPTIYQAELDAETAEVAFAKQEFTNTENLANAKQPGGSVVSQREVSLYKAKLARAEAKRALAEAKLNFATIRAPFDGLVDRLLEMQGSLIKEGDVLTTLSDNSTMWVYFNVPERRYIEYMHETDNNRESPDVELRLADLNKFPQLGKVAMVEAKFNNETGNIPFRADFPNPDGLLRHGQTGTVLIRRPLKDATIIPQRATYENLAKRYVFVVDKDDMVHQREIAIKNELEDIYVIEKGLAVGEKIILEGIRQVRDGEKVEFEYITPEEAMKDQKHPAE